jgi:hypothetical protein
MSKGFLQPMCLFVSSLLWNFPFVPKKKKEKSCVSLDGVPCQDLLNQDGIMFHVLIAW